MDMTMIAKPVGARAAASATDATRSPAMTNRSTLLLTRSDVPVCWVCPNASTRSRKLFVCMPRERSHLQGSSACPSKAADFTSR